jgi:hypothetical protein
MTIRVVQWTTGNVGKQSVEAVMKRPDLDLIGCYGWSADRAGKDIGEMCGLPPTGLAATNDVDGLLALKPRLRGLQPDVVQRGRDGPNP